MRIKAHLQETKQLSCQKRKRWGEVSSISIFCIAVQLSLVVVNICFSLHMRKKNAELWWLNIPVAVFCFLMAVLPIMKAVIK